MFRYNSFRRLQHSAKGSTWEDHKYIKRINGVYYYPDSYEGGRHLKLKVSETQTQANASSSPSSNKAKILLGETKLKPINVSTKSSNLQKVVNKVLDPETAKELFNLDITMDPDTRSDGLDYYNNVVKRLYVKKEG